MSPQVSHFGKNNPANQREVIDEQNIRKAEVRLSFSAQGNKLIIIRLSTYFFVTVRVANVYCVALIAFERLFHGITLDDIGPLRIPTGLLLGYEAYLRGYSVF